MSFSDLLNPVRRWFGSSPTARADDERQKSAPVRESTFALNDALYDNAAYVSHWDSIKADCFPNCPAGVRLFGYFMPFREIVDAYQNVLPGTFGHGVSIDPEFEGQPINPRLAELIRVLWRDSNLDSDKTLIQRHAANLGTVGMRPVFFPGDTAGEPGRVAIQYDHPSRLFYVEHDSQRNVVAVVLKYKLPRNFGTATDPKFQDVEVVEHITKESFSVLHDEVEQLDDSQRVNQHGFCPYVILRHKDNGNTFGDWAYKGSEYTIHAINYRISQQDRSVGRHMFPRWVFGAAGDRPQEIPMGAESAIFLKLSSDGPTPFVQALVPALNQAEAMGFWMELRDMMRGAQPELTINDVKLLGGISGETIRQVLMPAKSAILAVRPNYDHAFIRIIQMALSIGADLGVWDVGTGSGERAGDRAYQSGLENFTFAPRPALPATPDDVSTAAVAEQADKTARLTAAKAAQGIGVSNAEVLRIAGYTEKQIADMQTEKAQSDIVPTAGL